MESLQETDSVVLFLVILSQVPDYREYIKQPMDLSTVQSKVTAMQYENLEDFHNDIHLMISNCMIYNSKDTPFYRAALRMTDQVNLQKTMNGEPLTCRQHQCSMQALKSYSRPSKEKCFLILSNYYQR